MFVNVIGQNKIKEKLRLQLENEQISHAQLFLGATGKGGMALALDFAARILSKSRSNPSECENDPGFQKARKLVHPDLHLVFPYPKIKTTTRMEEFHADFRKTILENPYLGLYDWSRELNSENKQLNIPIRDCHNLMKKLSLKSFESEYKVAIIWMADFLGKEGNVLLKILEEPPENTVFLLVAEDQNKILNTILSRTQILKINNIEKSAIQQNLEQKLNINPDLAVDISNICNGNWADAVQLAHEGIDESAEIYKNWMRLLIMGYVRNNKKALSELLSWVDEFSKLGRERQKNFCNYALHILEALCHYSFAENIIAASNPEEQKILKALNDLLDLEQIEQLNELFNNTYYYLERNANIKVLMMNQSIKAGKILAGEKAKSSLTA